MSNQLDLIREPVSRFAKKQNTKPIMKFIVECQIQAGKKNRAIELFEQRGPNRNPGVSFRGAWIGAQADIAFVLVESPDEEAVKGAINTWSEIGNFRITQVIDVEQF
jgi:hypothetical protein